MFGIRIVFGVALLLSALISIIANDLEIEETKSNVSISVSETLVLDT